MEKGNRFFTLCVVFLVISGVIIYVYTGPMASEGNINLETRLNELETRLNTSESRLNELESRASEQLLIVSNLPMYEPQSISFMIIHIGTTEVTISEIRANNVRNSSSPGWVGNETLLPGQMGQITLYGLKYFADGFTDDGSYEFRFITVRGNSFYSVVRYEGWTIPQTEQLTILDPTWNDNNATFTVVNTGTTELTIVEVRVNDEYATMKPSSVTLYPSDETTIRVSKTEGFTSGVEYEFSFIMASGNRFFYVATAP